MYGDVRLSFKSVTNRYYRQPVATLSQQSPSSRQSLATLSLRIGGNRGDFGVFWGPSPSIGNLSASYLLLSLISRQPLGKLSGNCRETVVKSHILVNFAAIHGDPLKIIRSRPLARYRLICKRGVSRTVVSLICFCRIEQLLIKDEVCQIMTSIH